MSDVSPFRGLSKRFVTIDINGQKINVHPRVEDAEIFVSLKSGDQDEAAKITEIMVNMIHRANQQEDIEDIKAFVAQNYGRLIRSIAEIYGFANAEEFEQARKKLRSQ